jgi:2-polyprenyl-3-methyl-5-hydroxy-6-metoxy-1,4-benzoquinol methylase
VRCPRVTQKETIAGFFLSQFWPLREMDVLARFGLTARTRILDVGCGSGSLLQRLARAGFQDLTGADPFIKTDTSSNGVTILKRNIRDLDGEF